MNILCVGINHDTAPVTLRERLSLDEHRRRALMARTCCGDPTAALGITELVVLSTCNRIELYGLSHEPDFTALDTLLTEVSGVEPEAFAGHLYCLEGEEAVHHLMRVASGLDSQVLGEHEILGQVADSYMEAQHSGAVGPVLSRLFQAAIHAGKRARSETAISHRPASISSVAVDLAAGVVADLPSSKILVIGAGEMAVLVAEALRQRQVSRFTMVNRTVAHAQDLADRFGAEVRPFEDLGAALADADIAIASTAAPHTILERRYTEEIMQQRVDRPLVLIDIAVPRDIDETVGQIPGVHLFDIDNLNQQVDHTTECRRREIPNVEAILDHELGEFRAWFSTLPITPIIKCLRQQAEDIRLREVDRTLRRIPHLSDLDRDRIHQLTSGLIKKLLHSPTMCLRRESQNGSGPLYAMIARDLFDLGPGENEICESPCQTGKEASCPLARAAF